MNGADYLRRLQELMNEDSNSGWLDERSSYDYFYEAATEFVDRTACLKSSQTLTTVADQSEYNLKPDFLRLYAKNDDNEYIIKYYDGSDYSFPTRKDYGELFYDNNSTSVQTPSEFAIIDAELPSQITGTATSNGSASAGESTLTDSSADFSDVYPGASVVNTTDGSSGIVLEQASQTSLVTALFGGTNNEWATSDAYVIQPEGRYKIVLDPPPSTAGHTVVVPYVQTPQPVYSAYRSYRFPRQYSPALVKYAFWLYKYRDREPNYGDAMYKFWIAQIGRYIASVSAAVNKTAMPVNFKKRK